MSFPRFTFLLAGAYGILVVAPEYFFEIRYGQDHPPAITHAEFFYGFVGVCLVFQFLFLVVASDPVRFRPVMIIGVLEKVSFFIPAAILYLQGRLNPLVMFFAFTDFIWAGLFVAAYLKTPQKSP